MDEDWLIIDQNDWSVHADPEEVEEKAPESLTTNERISGIVEISGTTITNESFTRSKLRIEELVQSLKENSTSPLSNHNNFSLREVMRELSQVTSTSFRLTETFQELSNDWLPMFKKLHRLLSRRQVHYTEACDCLYALMIMLELSNNDKRIHFFQCDDSAHVIFQTSYHFGKKLTTLEQELIDQVFSFLTKEKDLTRIMKQANRKRKKSVYMESIIEALIKRCTKGEVKEHGRELLQQFEGYVCISRCKPLKAVTNIVENYT